jgi:DNA replication protein DnaC
MAGKPRAALADQAAAAAVDAAAVRLGLPTVRAQAGEMASQAARAGASYLGFLADVLAAECDDRADRRRARLVKEARFPRHKTLADFDPGRIGVDRAVIADLAGCGWVRAAQPLVLVGDSGTGKTHLLIGVGLAACGLGLQVRYRTCAQLANELTEAQDDRQLTRAVAKYARLDLLLLDEVGYLHLDDRGAELVFQVITARDERASIAVASNAPFAEWGRVFADPRLAAAVVDRLTFNAVIIRTGDQSYRLAATRDKTTTTTGRQARRPAARPAGTTPAATLDDTVGAPSGKELP